MIELQNIQIDIEGLKILPIENYYDLTSGCNIYNKSPHDGGLSFKSNVVLNDFEEGYVYVTQICTHHNLKISTLNGEYFFDSQNEIFRDTPSTTSCHFRFFPIKNNVVKNFNVNQNEITFFDAPFTELFPWWTAIDYSVKFETWIQYSNTSILNINMKPILKFNWELQAKANQENELWAISNPIHSSAENITDSIHYFSATDDPLFPCDLRHLGNTVQEFKLQHQELKKSNG